MINHVSHNFQIKKKICLKFGAPVAPFIILGYEKEILICCQARRVILVGIFTIFFTVILIFVESSNLKIYPKKLNLMISKFLWIVSTLLLMRFNVVKTVLLRALPFLRYVRSKFGSTVKNAGTREQSLFDFFRRGLRVNGGIFRVLWNQKLVKKKMSE